MKLRSFDIILCVFNLLFLVFTVIVRPPIEISILLGVLVLSIVCLADDVDARKFFIYHVVFLVTILTVYTSVVYALLAIIVANYILKRYFKEKKVI